MEDGWYWHIRPGDEPEVVRIIDDRAYRAGSDVACTLPGEAEESMLDKLEGTLIGPIGPVGKL